jgi:hypothetical protein
VTGEGIRFWYFFFAIFLQVWGAAHLLLDSSIQNEIKNIDIK